MTPPDETKTAVAAALTTGYRLIDTAAAYANERGVGDAIREAGLLRSRVPRTKARHGDKEQGRQGVKRRAD